ncbi:hypothetical protein KAI78_06745 [bacterium]|nr:hypothetical protein [bacterium]
MKKRSIYLLMGILLLTIVTLSCKKELPLPDYAKNIEVTENVANATTLRLLNMKIEEYQDDHGMYPETIEDLKPYIGGISLKGEGGGKYYYDGDEQEFKFDPEQD